MSILPEEAVTFGIQQHSVYADLGRLNSYDTDNADGYPRGAIYLDKIVKGRSRDLPIEQPANFELIINLKAAKQLELTIPPNVLARADKVIKGQFSANKEVVCNGKETNATLLEMWHYVLESINSISLKRRNARIIHLATLMTDCPSTRIEVKILVSPPFSSIGSSVDGFRKHLSGNLGLDVRLRIDGDVLRRPIARLIWPSSRASAIKRQ